VALATGCAGTVHDSRPAEASWRRPAPAAQQAPGTAAGEPLAVYVAAFGLSSRVADAHPELAAAGVGLGIGQRIADALWESGRFRLLEEKAEVVERIAGMLERSSAGEPLDDGTGEQGPEGAAAPGAASAAASGVTLPDEAAWLLYGEIAGLEVERRERVSGLAGRAELETRVTVQLRLVERASRRTVAATATGAAVAPPPESGGDLDPQALAAATGEAVTRAAAALAAKREGG
jgi:hypothetical protein